MKLLTALLVGIAIHAGMALLERIIPVLGAGLDPFLRLVPAFVASLLATASLRQLDRFKATTVGAIVAGLTGFFGMVVASWIWLPGGHLLPAIASVTGTSVLVGALTGNIPPWPGRKREPAVKEG